MLPKLLAGPSQSPIPLRSTIVRQNPAVDAVFHTQHGLEDISNLFFSGY